MSGTLSGESLPQGKQSPPGGSPACGAHGLRSRNILRGSKANRHWVVVYLNETIAFYVVLGSQTRRSFANEIGNELLRTGQGVTLVPLRGMAPGRGGARKVNSNACFNLCRMQ